MCTNFEAKRSTLTFLAQVCPIMDLGWEIRKTNLGIRISIVKMPCMPIFRKNGQLWLFRPKFAQKWILGSEFQKSKSRFGICTSKIACVPILTFLVQICPKRKLGFEIQKTNVGTRISLIEIPCVPLFRQNGQLWIFRSKFAQKWILGWESQKSKSGFGICTSKIPCVSIFS